MKYLIALLLWQQLYLHHCIRLEKVTCEVLDENFAKFDLCELKPNKNNEPALSIRGRLLQIPVKNCYVAADLIYAGSTIKRLLGNGTWDGCAFMRNRKRYLFLSRFYEIISNYTNMNHTCPYNDDIILKNLTPGFVKWPMPMPTGEYLISVTFIVDKRPRVSIRVSARSLKVK